MSIALLVTDRNLTVLAQGLKQALPGVNIQCWPDITQPEEVEFAVAWQQPKNCWAKLPALKVISSLGAGCDALLSDPGLPGNVRITRIVDPGLSGQMAEYVLASILMLKCRFTAYFRQQQQASWQVLPKESRRQKVTLLGVGSIGEVVAGRLMNNGFEVSGWRRSQKTHPDYRVYYGQDQLGQALADADYVVSILPNTPATQGLINKAFFEKLKPGCFLINVGRGQAVNDGDLIDALDKQVIAGAVLDVFNQEPLPEDHAFWRHESVLLTPHISAITDQQEVIAQIAGNYKRFQQGQLLDNLVDVAKGY
ncbi:2-hydroxyacid dehydrogenase [Thalassomonas actiniarum]|uniref:Glyoxylate/hydroxypyruvate reductase A n=1 Tax=Thalassomonas actiniarum TaxID=485447 RepID=A0AAE9YTF3_9GAMM|nr:glyoxylate/hydroxypyruvate reductase A [Thalassomonas actiniarum]WDE00442.1 glyoxylate/hydroxypyruvate reductase A [Thalassomonas actiniarum]